MMICSSVMRYTAAQTSTALFQSSTVSTTFSTNSQFEGKDDQYCQLADIVYDSPLESGEMTCWCSNAAATTCEGAYAQVDLGTQYTVTQVGTYGCQWEGKDKDEWITSYQIAYSQTGTTSSWSYYGATFTAGGAEDAQYETKNTFSPPIEARYFRLYPLSSVESCSTDWELYGYPPTPQPTNNPSKRPTASPTKVPTKNPSALPTKTPSKLPSGSPTKNPSKVPTASPSNVPTVRPTAMPSKLPTGSPTEEDGEAVDEDNQDEDEGAVNVAPETEPEEAGLTSLFGALSPLELIMVAATLCVVCMCCVIAIVITKRVRDGKDDAEEDETNMIEMQSQDDVTSVNSGYAGEGYNVQPPQVQGMQSMPMYSMQSNVNMNAYAMPAQQQYSGYGAFAGVMPNNQVYGHSGYGQAQMQAYGAPNAGVPVMAGLEQAVPAVIPAVADTPQYAGDDSDDDEQPVVAGFGGGDRAATTQGIEDNPNRFANGSFSEY